MRIKLSIFFPCFFSGSPPMASDPDERSEGLPQRVGNFAQDIFEQLSHLFSRIGRGIRNLFPAQSAGTSNYHSDL